MAMIYSASKFFIIPFLFQPQNKKNNDQARLNEYKNNDVC